MTGNVKPFTIGMATMLLSRFPYATLKSNALHRDIDVRFCGTVPAQYIDDGLSNPFKNTLSGGGNCRPPTSSVDDKVPLGSSSSAVFRMGTKQHDVMPIDTVRMFHILQTLKTAVFELQHTEWH